MTTSDLHRPSGRRLIGYLLRNSTVAGWGAVLLKIYARCVDGLADGQPVR